MRLHNYFGLGGNKIKQQPMWYPEVTVSRNTIREMAHADDKLRRAIALTAQYCFIQNNWNHTQYHVDFTQDPQKVMDALLSDKSRDLKSEMLGSRSYWTFKEDNDKHPPYMSLFKILELCGFAKK